MNIEHWKYYVLRAIFKMIQILECSENLFFGYLVKIVEVQLFTHRISTLNAYTNY